MSSGAAAGLPAPPAGTLLSPAGRERVLWIVVALGTLVALAAALTDTQPVAMMALFVIPLVIVAFQRWLLSWQTLLGLILLVILFIPIRRYSISSGLPLSLEPYRLVIALVLTLWALALAADPRVRWRATGYGLPILMLWTAIFASIIMNIHQVTTLGDSVFKTVTFFGSYFVLMCFITSTLTPGRPVDRMLQLLVLGGGVLACCALYEWRTGVNSFNGLSKILPMLDYADQGKPAVRGTGVRAYASAEHPIAMGAAFVMLLPISIYLYKRSAGRVLWLGIGGLMTLAALSTGSRTAMVMLITVFVTLLVLKRAAVVGMLPQILVLIVLVQGVMPGTLGTFKVILNPNFVVEEQSTEGGTGAGRIADLGPALGEWSQHPFVGQGYGTRITSLEGVYEGAQILDDQWLTSLLEIGAVGVIGLFWLFARAIKRLAVIARRGDDADSWLGAGLAASLVAFILGMLTFDAFAFIQVTFLAFILLGLASVATGHLPRARLRPAADPVPPPTRRRRVPTTPQFDVH